MSSIIGNGIYAFGSGGTPSDDPFALTDYIESSGTQWIDTGYFIKDISRFEMVANITSGAGGTYATPFGVRNGHGATQVYEPCYFFARYNSGNDMYVNWGGGEVKIGSGIFYGSKAVYELVKGSLSTRNDAHKVVGNVFTSLGSATNNYSLYLFVLNEGSIPDLTYTLTVMKLYRFRIYEGSILVHEFIPWKDSNDVVCVKDTVTGNLKYNQGTGVFTRGTDT